MGGDVRKVVVCGVLVILAVQLLAVTQFDGEAVLGLTGAALACALIAARTRLDPRQDDTTESVTDDADEALRRWLLRTETLISWAESSRADWDRRLRPMLARQFELAAGHRKSKDPRMFEATGRMLFGDELWQWVDPDNIARDGHGQPGPGRATLDDILQRLERL
ncbi:Histidine kinase [Mycobacterium sp. smrl_JER01]